MAQDTALASTPEAQNDPYTAAVDSTLGQPPAGSPNAAGGPAAPSGDPFAAAVDSALSGSAQQLRNSLQSAASTNPDAEAAHQRLAEITGMPLTTVRNLPAVAKTQAAQAQFPAEQIAAQYPQTASVLQQPDNMRMLHDDVGSLTGLEDAVRGLGQRAGKALAAVNPFLANVVSAMSGGGPVTDPATPLARNALQGLSYAGAQTNLALAHLAAVPFALTDIARSIISGHETNAATDVADQALVNPAQARSDAAAQPPGASFPSRLAFGAGSMLGYLPGMLLGGAGDAPAAADASTTALQAVRDSLLHAGRAAALPATVAGVNETGDVYRRTGSMSVAAKAGVAQTLLSELQMSLPMAAPGSVGMRALSGALLGSSANEVQRQLLNLALPKEMQQPFDPEETLIQGILGAGLGAGLGPHGTHDVADYARQVRDAADATDTQAGLQDLSRTAAASKFRARAPEAFHQFVADLGDEHGVDNLYVDADKFVGALNQAGVPQADVAKLMPEVGKQFTEAGQTDGMLRIPLEDYATHIAGTPLDQALLPELKTSPDGMTFSQAQAFRQDQAQRMQEVAQKLAQEPAGAERAAALQTVEQHFRDQLDQAGRFPATTNDAYAKLLAHMYDTLSDRLGTSPEEMLRQYPLQVRAEDLPGATLEQPAYHGSPHDFDRFSTDKIGTGEGAQAYGHGLYFAEDPAVAESYHKSLSMKVAHIDGQVPERGTPEWEAANSIAAHGYEAALAQARKSAEFKFLSPAGREQAGKLAETIESLKDRKIEDKASGAVYQVDIPDEIVGKMLDWDKPLSEQPAAVREALAQVSADHYAPESDDYDPEESGQVVYMRLADMLGSQKAASEALEKAGVHGIRYLDRGSRPDGEGSRNLVVFNDKHVTITHKDGTPVVGDERDQVLEQSLRAKRAPVARLTGDELHTEAHPQITRGNVVEAARNWFKANLQGKTVEREGLGPVRISGKTWGKIKGGLTIDPEKARLLPAIPDIIAHGDYTGRSPIDKPRNDKIVAFHHFEAPVDVGGVVHQVGVSVGEEADGKLVYNLTKDPRDLLEKRNPRLLAPGVAQGAGVKVDSDVHDQSVAPSDDGINLEILRQGEAPRGQIQFGRDLSAQPSVISLLEHADLSTMLHETGHFFLEAYSHLAEQPDAPPEIKADMDAVAKWFGAKDLAGWRALSLEDRRAGHEQFAQGFEKYLMEGKAPTPELQSLFGRFRAWLLQVYQSLRGLGVQLTPEVRGVMDRMLASQKAIEEAERIRAMVPLFKAKPDGMTDEQFRAYQALGDEATQDAITQMQSRSLRDMKWLSGAKDREIAKLQRQADSARRGIREQVEQEVAQMPVYRAEHFLRTGELEAGDLSNNQRKAFDNTQGLRSKLDLGALKEMYGEGPAAPWRYLSTGEHGLATAKDGIHPDDAAEILGFDNGDQLVRALLDAEPRKSVVEGLTDKRMLEEHGDLVDPQSIARAAEAAIHNEARAKFIATELKAVSQATGDARLIAAAAKDAAESRIAETRVRDLRPLQYTVAEARASREAERAMGKGDTLAAAWQKRAQLLNNRLAKAAADAVQDVDKGVDYLKKFAKAGVRKNIDVDHLEQIDALLAQYDLRKSVRPGQVEPAKPVKPLAAWVDEQRAAGYEPGVTDEVAQRTAPTHYRDLSVEQFRGLLDAVKSIEYLGRRIQTIRDGDAQRELDEVAREAADKMATLPQRKPESNRGIKGVEAKWLKLKSQVRSADASMLKMEQVFDWLDDHDPNGVFNRVVFRPIADAAGRENDLRTEIVGKLKGLIDALPAEFHQHLSDKLVIPELVDGQTGRPQALLKSELLAVALNAGNESNFDKLLRGEGWSEQGVRTALDRHMTKADWDFTQGVLDLVESLWPRIVEVERNLGNTAPDKIEARPIETRFGTYRGGYYPVVYDPARDFTAEQHRQRAADSSLFDNNYARATTPKGHTIARKETYARPLLLSLDVIPRHLDQVIHDIAMREVLMDADRFLADKRIQQGISSALGREYYEQLRPWLQGIANDRVYDAKGMAFWDRLAHKTRTSATMVGLGYNLTTMLVHGMSAASNSFGELGARWMASGIRSTLGTPDKLVQARDFVFERSAEMRNRMNEVDRDVRDALREMQVRSETGTLSKVGQIADAARRFAYYGITMLDMGSALPTWMGAYNRALHEGAAEADAVYQADKAVRNAHGGAGSKDLSRVQRGNEVQKLATMFYTYWNHFYNRTRDTARAAAQIPGKVGEGDYAGARRDFAMVLARSWWYLVLPSIIHGLIKAPASQDENRWWWLAKTVGMAPLSGIPVVRDIASALERGREYSFSPIEQLVNTFMATAKDAEHAATGQPVSDRWAQHAIATAGYTTGLPVGQFARTGEFLWDVHEGKQTPQDLADWYRGLATGRMKAGR